MSDKAGKPSPGASIRSEAYPDAMVPYVPAPWTLDGRGYMVLYRFTRATRRRVGWGSEVSSGLGALMLVDYRSSDAGPYREALFIPGKLKTPRGRRHRITRIFVSTMDSVVNGRINWAIPKELGSMEFKGEEDGSETIQVDGGGVPMLRANFTPHGPSFPVNTAWLPFPLSQEDGRDWVHTTFFGRGKGRLARLNTLWSNAEAFPALGGLRPLVALEIDPFKITFPVASRDKGR